MGWRTETGSPAARAAPPASAGAAGAAGSCWAAGTGTAGSSQPRSGSLVEPDAGEAKGLTDSLLENAPMFL
ncbi:hypothetical protein B1L11_05190 [Microbispora sp. GKU 823]|nr:hypothetical protein B1L11_05190 [Microbispora sp. GKU 823]